MLAIGCLFPVLFFIGGSILGAMWFGERGSIWGAIVGFVLGLIMPASLFLVYARTRKPGKQRARTPGH